MFPSQRRNAVHIVWMLAVSAAYAAPGAARAHDPALITTLSHFHEDPSDEVLDAFEPGLRDALLAIADDEGVLRLARVRAVAALGRYADDDAVFDRVAALARDSAGDIRLRIAAVGTVNHRFAHRPEATALLSEILSDPDPGLRRFAVDGLARIGTPEADAILSRHRMVERHVVVRRALRGAREAQLGRPLPPEGPMRRPLPTGDAPPEATLPEEER